MQALENDHERCTVEPDNSVDAGAPSSVRTDAAASRNISYATLVETALSVCS